MVAVGVRGAVGCWGLEVVGLLNRNPLLPSPSPLAALAATVRSGG